MSISKISEIDYWNPTLWEFTFDDSFSDIKFYVKEVSIPHITLEKEQRNTGYSYYTGYTPEEDFSITFIEDKDLTVYNYLKKWQYEIFDYNNRVFKRGDHSKNGVLLIQQDRGNTVEGNARKISSLGRLTIKRLQFVNMMLLSIENIELNYEDGEGKNITATFECDAVQDSDFTTSPVQRLGGGI